MFLHPDSKACAEIYGEGPDAWDEEEGFNQGNYCVLCKYQYMTGQDGMDLGCAREDQELPCKFEEEGEEINLYPNKCNLCGGKVVFTSNSIVYGKEYGSGKCYYCIECGAYVGTHKPRPRKALGILADKEMRELKKECHKEFDKFWKGKRMARAKRNNLYRQLADELGISIDKCHFGYFDTEMLLKALEVLKGWGKKNENISCL